MNRSNAWASFDIVHIVLDFAFVFGALFVSYLIWWNRSGLTNAQWVAIWPIYLVSVFIFFLVNRSLNVYNTTVFFYIDRILKRESFAFLCGFGVSFILITKSLNYSFKNIMFIGLAITTYLFIVFEILLFRSIIDRIIMRKHVPRALYVGSKDSYNKFRYFLKKTSIQLNEIGYISYDDDADSLEYIGKLSDLESIIRKYNIDQVYFLQKREMDVKELQKYIDICIEMGVTSRVIVDTFRRRKSFSFVSSIGTYPVVTFHTVSMNR